MSQKKREVEKEVTSTTREDRGGGQMRRRQLKGVKETDEREGSCIVKEQRGRNGV